MIIISEDFLEEYYKNIILIITSIIKPESKFNWRDIPVWWYVIKSQSGEWHIDG